ncbi:Rha family transcriptional regulator [Aliterella atlantica]|uniref:Rha family transcriptional regulator n=1 Tax=Aliterella atlantica TaxID=1827278 RepID=UPI0006986510|nr:Rha family transcriptional regulator [Aliterella atlantica]
MSLLTVSDRGDGLLLVDSRLVADELGIQHKNFLATIEKYNPLMASNPVMGAVAFETREFQTKQGNVSYERWAWLTELQATFIMTLSRNTEQVVNCKLALAVAFEKAKQVIKQVIPAQSQEIERLKLELQVAQAQATAAQSQERLMQATNAIAALHGSGLVELVLGKADAIVTRTEVVEKTVAVDAKTGRVLAQSDGMTIGYLTKRLGFKNNEQTWQWLNSVQLGKDSGAWSRELTAHPTLKLPRHLLPQIQRLFAYQVGNRQLLLGEGGGR